MGRHRRGRRRSSSRLLSTKLRRSASCCRQGRLGSDSCRWVVPSRHAAARALCLSALDRRQLIPQSHGTCYPFTLEAPATAKRSIRWALVTMQPPGIGRQACPPAAAGSAAVSAAAATTRTQIGIYSGLRSQISDLNCKLFFVCLFVCLFRVPGTSVEVQLYARTSMQTTVQTSKWSKRLPRQKDPFVCRIYFGLRVAL